ncbi:hypothetical protein RchiOBHm_Chr4g0412951 [Rosa chinensis]|uniref:Uncharacterized protein n=2 Tax=Rosa chinensis TaxID=74649 RepID=A0A2P6QW13_ROSCH|nr:uncharacterized protein LOC121052610 isoform X2 [Rosa chinensis]PRQ38356.1 hypothetical protein RchiOBHm_Chr4g0412951 [Rosa chinensis]
MSSEEEEPWEMEDWIDEEDPIEVSSLTGPETGSTASGPSVNLQAHSEWPPWGQVQPPAESFAADLRQEDWTVRQYTCLFTRGLEEKRKAGRVRSRQAITRSYILGFNSKIREHMLRYYNDDRQYTALLDIAEAVERVIGIVTQLNITKLITYKFPTLSRRSCSHVMK